MRAEKESFFSFLLFLCVDRYASCHKDNGREGGWEGGWEGGIAIAVRCPVSEFVE